MLRPFTPPDYSDVYTFTCSFGEVKCLKADYEYVREVRWEWVQENPPPDPPLIPVKPSSHNWTFRLARQAREFAKKKGISIEQAEEIIASKAEWVADPDSEEYQKLLTEYAWQKFTLVESLLLTNWTLYETRDGLRTLEHIVNSENSMELAQDYNTCVTMDVIRKMILTEERLAFNKFFMQISTVTWEHVLAAGDKIGILWKGNPVLRMIPESDSGEEQSIYGLGVLAAKAVGLTPNEFSGKTIVQQSEILAIDLIDKWLKRFQIEEENRKRALQQQQSNPEAMYRSVNG